MMRSMRVMLTLAVMLLIGAGALAQPGLQEARSALEAARASEQIPHPDQPLWREAIRQAEAARRQSPQHADTLDFLAGLYSETGWYVRAWDAWNEWRELTGRAVEHPGYAEAGHQLGFARYQAGDLEEARQYYAGVLQVQPANETALGWLSRIALESGDLPAAEEYARRQLGLNPADASAAARLRQIALAETHGTEAAAAFASGSSHYELGNVEQALESFSRAVAAAPSFTEAVVWAARTAQELGQPQVALGYWERAVELDPEDERSRYFRGLAQRQATWGIPAVTAFEEGQARYAEDDLEAALEAFTAAAAAAPDYVDALAWTARVAQESGLPELARDFWQRVVVLDPDDESAAWFLSQLERRLQFGEAASDEFVAGVTAYQEARFAEAEVLLQEAAELNPDFAPAWGYLGQLYMAQGRYALAAEAYGTARRLEPANETWVYFALEARRLAGPASPP